MEAYPPELMELMSVAFDAAYDACESEPSQAVQLQLATRIMAAVNVGVRDLEQLTEIALGAASPSAEPGVEPEAEEAPEGTPPLPAT
jgi:hypothetical protein